MLDRSSRFHLVELFTFKFTATPSFAQKIENCDPSLFSTIHSQSTPRDHRSLLALHAAAHQAYSTFSYLEVGSHICGSMQAMIADPACTSIISIDPRPTVFGDELGLPSEYPSNSTQRMLNYLAQVPGADLAKLRTIESPAQAVAPEDIFPAPHFCFIDAEHTTVASLADARWCLKVVRPGGCIAFPDAVFVVELGEGTLLHDPRVKQALAESWRSYMFALRAFDWYRAVLNKLLFRLLRRTRFVRRIFGVKEEDV